MFSYFMRNYMSAFFLASTKIMIQSCLKYYTFCCHFLKSDLNQGWEFAHRFSERITRILREKKRAIRSFLVSDLSDSLKVAHFL